MIIIYLTIIEIKYLELKLTGIKYLIYSKYY